jgi:hypothetical protein
MPTMQTNVEVNEEQSRLIAKTLALPFEYESIFLAVEYIYHKGWVGNRAEPPEPEEVEINLVYIIELYDIYGNVHPITGRQSKLLNTLVETTIDPIALETKCFEHNESEEDEEIIQRAISYYEEHNIGDTNEY